MHDISIISIIFTVALLLVCLFLTISPLFKWDSYLPGNAKPELAGMKEALLTTLNELEFEYKMDKISQTDYQHLKKQYEIQIAVLMKEDEHVDEQKMNQALMAEIEREIEATMKSYKKKKGEGK
ncbi:hypothetical protein E2K98_15540 [Bacillus salipaludis]|uniref:C-type cytochrome biogenesis protein CcmI n=1 Tax=Bacillus salipaludis TaxID=2547811 RepID=A0A4V3ATI0_9BACI|nr:hypothetical protein [Bacillus salipaludis]MDQ6599610.1 hypothetical protein [Bacillus salipaludis]TDK60123.1 hypothetical protein E2K98_15540 [Bacillus salipaludis]